MCVCVCARHGCVCVARMRVIMAVPLHVCLFLSQKVAYTHQHDQTLWGFLGILRVCRVIQNLWGVRAHPSRLGRTDSVDPPLAACFPRKILGIFFVKARRGRPCEETLAPGDVSEK